MKQPYMFNNKSFYPTPEPLILKMIAKIQNKKRGIKILEPSAGAGDIIETMESQYRDYRLSNFSAIEIDTDLQATLRGKKIKVIDNDFLNFAGPDKFDLIIANPPFNEGDKHLLKAIDIMYRGEIIFLLNAETIKNHYTILRKELVKKLSALNADIEYIPNAFIDADRKTGVEVALIYINIKRQVEDDLFQNLTAADKAPKPEIETNYEVSTRKTIDEMVAEYNQIIRIGTETIINYYKNYKKISQYIGLNQEAKKDYSDCDMTSKMQNDLNDMIIEVRKNFWYKTLKLEEVTARLTYKKKCDFEYRVETQSDMDFTENNIRQFILNLIGSYEQILIEAVIEIFDKFTKKHCYSDGLYDENIHYFSGWKTNNAFKVNKKVIIPMHGGYGRGPFTDYSGGWKLCYEAEPILSDIDKVMSYFDGMNNYYSINEAIQHSFTRGETRNIESTYFTITCYKKGTIHLTFNSADILRRFNVAACLGKNWLPHEYGHKTYTDMSCEEKEIVESFEGQSSYNQNLGRSLFTIKPLLQIE